MADFKEFNPVLTKEQSNELWNTIFKEGVNPDEEIRKARAKSAKLNIEFGDDAKQNIVDEAKVLFTRILNIFKQIKNCDTKEKLAKFCSSLVKQLSKLKELLISLNKSTKVVDKCSSRMQSIINVLENNKNTKLVYLIDLVEKAEKELLTVSIESDRLKSSLGKSLKKLPNKKVTFSLKSDQTAGVVKASVYIITKYKLNQSLIKKLDLREVQYNCYLLTGKFLVINTDKLRKSEKPIPQADKILKQLRERGSNLFAVRDIHTENKNYFAILCIDGDIGKDFTVLTDLMLETNIMIDFV